MFLFFRVIYFLSTSDSFTCPYVCSNGATEFAVVIPKPVFRHPLGLGLALGLFRRHVLSPHFSDNDYRISAMEPCNSVQSRSRNAPITTVPSLQFIRPLVHTMVNKNTATLGDSELQPLVTKKALFGRLKLTFMST